ncbi:MAG: dicarboxylate/amino acid:cation symporter, partial [Verrucomicrobiota bacterium]
GIAGVGNQSGFGKRGLKTLGYYVCTSAISILIGLTLVNLIKPGLTGGEPNPQIKDLIERNEEHYQKSVGDKLSSAGVAMDEKSTQSFSDVFKRMIPTNVFQAFSSNSQMLALITVSLLTGFGVLFISEGARENLMGFFTALNELMLLITRWIMLLAPIGVFGLVSATVAQSGFALFGLLAKYFVVVLIALAIHMFVVMPLILKFVAGVNPLRHFKAMRNALLTAFSTASSSGTLPVTLRGLQENVGVSNKVSSFVLPLGATVNMDGTALYECVAVLFISQVLGLQLTFAEQLTVVILALLTSIGVAGVPSASLVAIVIIVNNVLADKIGPGSATAVIGVLLAVDRLLDMSRTAVNVFSDSVGAVVIAKLEGETGLLEDPMHTAHEPLPDRTD